MIRFVVAAVLAVGAALPAGADIVAYWNFNTLTTATNNGTSYPPSSGAGSLTLVVPNTDNAGSNRGINSFAGTTTNAITPDVAGQALAIQGGALESGTFTAATGNNGSTLTLSFSMTGLQDAVLTFATQRTSTGFNNNQLRYSTDGVTYTSFGAAYSPATSFALQTFDLSSVSAIDNVSTAYLQIVFDGVTSYSGNNRIDNIQVNASTIPVAAIPEPSAFLFGGLMAGVAALGGRRLRSDKSVEALAV